ncbi:unnamed protein product [Kuraishia capsulata CBS 1993]|uniref:Fe2OG dioxygenase domain-containing protein n=1 Tax=Kuraishia capsulata CBS 1993 TaxID=1382522 RepID=W6MPX8_9ASCO|nr:uncharacterized protein KUCA_T00004764001 [Kuraishia capsulata CBS 1993]CDK28779.1 unnamed protein product [Kuraishia capsulata CBS 1993]
MAANSATPKFDLPLIDISSYGQGQEDRLVEDLMAAGKWPGFFYLVNHEISHDEIDKIINFAQSYFKNTSSKEKMKWKNSSGDTGYTDLRDEKLSGLGNGDLKESYYLSEENLKKNNIPAEFVAEKQFLDLFVTKCKRVANTVLHGLSVGLGLQPDFLSSKHSGERNRLRLIHYPPVEAVSDPDHPSLDIRAGQHSDYGSLTMLFVSPKDKGGLQVLIDNTWFDVPIIPYTIIFNIGDALEFWTAGMFRSTVHRVLIPRDDSENRDRYSIPFFVQPDTDVILSPIGSGGDISKFERILKEKYPGGMPTTAGEHLQSRIRTTYS